jgi:hypothetical protein
MDAATRRVVWQRAEDRCEYCRMRQAEEPFFRYHVEHIIPRQHGGGDENDNLALACPQCNIHKGPNLAGIDPLTGAMVPLFHPRRQNWADHFEAIAGLVAGRTPTGRVTVAVFNMNEPARVAVRHVADGV